jgi:hypothetical protein
MISSKKLNLIKKAPKNLNLTFKDFLVLQVILDLDYLRIKEKEKNFFLLSKKYSIFS